MGSARGDLAELAAVDDVANLLMRAAEEGVRRRADLQIAAVGGMLECIAFLERRRTAFRIGVLASGDQSVDT